MGSDKALLPWPPVATRVPFSGETFLSAAIRSLTSATDQVVVVVGNNQAQLAPVVYAAGGSLVQNLAPENGQFSSLRVGLQEVLNLGRDAVMITLIGDVATAYVQYRTFEQQRIYTQQNADLQRGLLKIATAQWKAGQKGELPVVQSVASGRHRKS
jgi:outer membrane protein TolC